ncbi:WD40 repeat domain-containing protein [Aurantimonas sp. VKM B-3413]|uniref:WD40 repeat domain-containing protein n=1 Tax=Aurantimonas sp. VKM B-3413 TaxID=2779401 RepID=UPI001E391E6A|nr:WD40 repeat domain-containing protein [Aurantimonas sp. VKM B-3413]MCB8839529.1 WD40 repeat domain-containing protein [Aurantimonas sp. VKM B-3413]
MRGFVLCLSAFGLVLVAEAASAKDLPASRPGLVGPSSTFGVAGARHDDRSPAIRLADGARPASTTPLVGTTSPALAAAAPPEPSRIELGEGWRFDLTQGHSQAVTSIAFGPDGSWFASASKDGTAKVWNTATGALMGTVNGSGEPVNAVAVQPGTGLLATADDTGVIRLFDRGPDATRTLGSGGSTGVGALDFSPNGALLAAGVYQGVEIWDVASASLVRRIDNAQKGMVRSVRFSPDGSRLLTAGYEPAVNIWDAGSGKSLLTITADGNVNAAKFAASGRNVATASTSGLSLFDAATGAMLHQLNGHKYGVYDVAVSPDGATLASVGGPERIVRFWNVATGAAGPSLQESVYSSDRVAFSPDGASLATGSGGAEIDLWRLPALALSHQIEIHADDVNAVAFAPDGTLAVGGALGGGVALWDSQSATLSKTVPTAGYVLSAAFSPRGDLLAAASSRLIEIFDAASGEQVARIPTDVYTIPAVAFSPDGEILAAATGAIVGLWSSRTGAPILSLDGKGGDVSSAVFSPDGSLVAASLADKTIRIWNAGTGAQVASLGPGRFGASRLAFSPDGRTLAGGSYSEVTLWDVASGRSVRSGEGLSSTVLALAFSPDGRRIAVAQGGVRTVAILDAASGHLVTRLADHADTIASLAFSADGLVLASGSHDHLVKLWDIESGAEIAALVTYDSSAAASGAASVRAARLWLSAPSVEADISARAPTGSQAPLPDILKAQRTVPGKTDPH